VRHEGSSIIKRIEVTALFSVYTGQPEEPVTPHLPEIKELLMNRILFTLFCLFLICARGSAADDDKTKASVKVIGLDIHRTNENEQILTFNPGTTVEVLLTQPGKSILSIDPKASRLASITDDKKTDLTKTKSAFGRDWLNAAFLRFNKDNSQCVFQIYAPSTPAEGASKIMIKANFAVIVGKEEKTAEQKNVTLKVGEKAKLDAIAMTVEKGFGDGKQVTVSFITPERSIKSLEFIDSKGKAIPSIFPNTNPTFANGKGQFQTSCSLPVQTAPVTIKATYFSKTETVNVPVDLSFGLGF
jgi:hypothetical protein